MAHFIHETAKWLLLGGACMAAACGGEPVAEDAPGDPSQHTVLAGPPPAKADHAPNHPPTIQMLQFDPGEARVGDSLRVDVDVVDEEGDPVWLTYSWSIDDQPAGENEDQLSLAGIARGSRVEVTVVATDGKDESEPELLDTEVGNSAPVVTGLELSPASSLHRGLEISLRPQGRDADGDPVEFRYEWTVNDRPTREQEATFATDRLRRGDVVKASVVASDGRDESEPFLTPGLPVLNAPPTIVSRPGWTSEDGTFRYEVVAEDPDGDTDFVFALEEAPDGMQIDDRSGAIRWNPPSDEPGTYRAFALVSDGHGGEARQEFEVNVGEANGAAAPASDDW